jgi:hypothetical protein
VCAGAARGRWPPHGRPGPPRHAGVALGAPRHLSPLRAYKGALSRGPGEGASVGLGVWEASLEGTKWLACHGRWRVVLQKGALTVPICRPRPQPLPLAPGVQGKLARGPGVSHRTAMPSYGLGTRPQKVERAAQTRPGSGWSHRGTRSGGTAEPSTVDLA